MSEKRGTYIGRMLHTYRRSARLRGVEWALSRDEFSVIVTQPCAYCGEAPRTRIFRQWRHHKKCSDRYESLERVNGIDRIDNAKGYTLENAAPCCTACNRLKGEMSLAEMLTLIARILARAG